MFWIIWISMCIIVISIFIIDEFIPEIPKTKLGKWWRNHIITREND